MALNLIVCLKRVPDTTARIAVGPDGRRINPEGIDTIINPYDEFAIEEALKIREVHGGEVVGVTLDPDGNETILRKALAMGVDRGVLVVGGDPFDAAATAEILASVLRSIPFDLLLFGKQSIDSDAYAVPGMVAHRLGLPRATVVVRLTVGDRRVTVHRQIEGAEEVLELPMPCLIAAQKGLNEPRFPSLKGIMQAKKKPLERRDAPPVEPRIEILRMEPPPPRPAGRIVGEGPGAAAELLRLLREEAKVL
jgi:electron transfer flavoprotein beta subunit